MNDLNNMVKDIYTNGLCHKEHIKSRSSYLRKCGDLCYNITIIFEQIQYISTIELMSMKGIILKCDINDYIKEYTIKTFTHEKPLFFVLLPDCRLQTNCYTKSIHNKVCRYHIEYDTVYINSEDRYNIRQDPGYIYYNNEKCNYNYSELHTNVILKEGYEKYYTKYIINSLCSEIENYPKYGINYLKDKNNYNNLLINL